MPLAITTDRTDLALSLSTQFSSVLGKIVDVKWHPSVGLFTVRAQLDTGLLSWDLDRHLGVLSSPRMAEVPPTKAMAVHGMVLGLNWERTSRTF